MKSLFECTEKENEGLKITTNNRVPLFSLIIFLEVQNFIIAVKINILKNVIGNQKL